MKILFLSSLYPPHARGGGELSMHYIAQALRAREHDVRVITSGIKREAIDIEGVPVLRLPVPLTAKPLFERRLTKKIAKILAKEIQDYDIVHAHDFRTAMVLSELNISNAHATARDYAHICGSPNNLLADGSTCPGCNWTTVWKNMGVVEAPFARRPFRAWQYAYNLPYRRRTWQQIPNHIFISHAQQAEFRAQGMPPAAREQVIYNPIPPHYLTAKTKPGTAGSVLFVGTLRAYKGINLLLAAWEEIAKRVPHAHLKIVGEGPLKSRLAHQIDQHGLRYRVTIECQIPWNRMLRVYDETNIVVSPHLWIEPFGRVVAEGLARGKIVVAADTGGPAEMIKDNATGLLFARGSQAALMRRLLDALQLPPARRQMITAAAQKWVRHNLAADLIAAAHEQLYQAPAAA